ncbi:MAG: hypothetical protein H7067_06005, partial [Burkholderiales bacterium]|nr:hypothetical protein [Opitutaceae bacterium]
LYTGDGQNPSVTYPGYAAMVNVNPSASGALELRRRVTTAPSALVTATSAYPAALGGAPSAAQKMTAGIDYVGTLVLERTTADTLALTLSLSGGTLFAHSIARTDTASPVLAFDTAMVSLYSAGGTAGAGALILDEASLAHAVPGGFAGWRQALFTVEELADELISGPESDVDGDGIALLAAYAFGAEDGRVPAELRPALSVLGEGAGRYLALSFTRRSELPDVTITAEATSELAGTWDALDAARFSAPVDLGDGTELVLVQDTVPLDETAARFLRLRISVE